MGADRKDLLLRVLTSLFEGSLLPSYSGGTWQPAPTFAHTNPTLSAETPQKVPSGDGRDGVVGGLHQPSAGGLRCKEGARREVLQHSCTAELALPGGARPASVLKQKEATPRVPWKQGMPAAPRRPQQQSAQVPPRALRASAARCAPRTRRRAARGGAAAATRTPRAARAAAVGGKRLRGAGPPQRRSPRRNPRTAAAQAAPALRR